MAGAQFRVYLAYLSKTAGICSNKPVTLVWIMDRWILEKTI